MLSNFLTVAQQVAILYLLIAVGFFCGKTKFLSGTAIEGMTNFVLYIVAPCVIVQSFQRTFDVSLTSALFQAAAFSAAITLIAYVLARLTLRAADKRRQSVYRFAVLFSNCAFMGLPLENALLGADGLFFGAACLAVYTIFTWTLGLQVMSGGQSTFNCKKLFTNPGILGVALGLILFFTSTPLPTVLSEPVGYLAALNTPVPMVIIGYHLSHAHIGPILKDLRTWLAIAERLVVVPLLGLVLGLVFHMDATALLACMIVLCPPTAAMCTMFAVNFKQDAELSVSLVSLSTLLSIFTMPLIIVLTRTCLSFS